MFVVLIFSIVLALDSFNQHLSSGRNVVRGQFPFIAHIRSLTPTGPDFCPGSLIGPSTVLTTSQCCACGGGSQNYTVTLNAYRQAIDTYEAVQDDCTETYSVFTSECDPSAILLSTSFQNDFCILRLPRQSSYTPVTLYDSDVIRMSRPADSARKPVVILGFGARRESGPVSDTLQKIQVPILDVGQCLERWKSKGLFLNKSKVFCGDVKNKKDACGKDAGASVFTKLSGKFLQLGIVTAGDDSCETNTFFPGLYSKIDEKDFKRWISPILAADKPTKRPTLQPTSKPSKAPTVRPSKISPTARSATAKKLTTSRPMRTLKSPTFKATCINKQFP